MKNIYKELLNQEELVVFYDMSHPANMWRRCNAMYMRFQWAFTMFNRAYRHFP